MFLETLTKQKGILGIMVAIIVHSSGAVAQNAYAMPVNSQCIMSQTSPEQAAVEKIQKFLNLDIVKQRLAKLGLSEKNINNYVAAMNSAKLQRLADKIDSVESAGNGDVIVVLLLLLVFVSVLCFTNYTFRIEPRHDK